MARRTFFSFHYQPDIWRAMNVRNSWVVGHDRDRQSDGFYDGSVFESKKRTSDDALKAFLRDGLANTSVTCVLAGSETWERRWVRYEIVQSVLKGNGLLTVEIHSVGDRQGGVCARTYDPLAQIGLYRGNNGSVYFAEWKRGEWVQYGDYQLSVDESALWFGAPTSSTVVQLCNHCYRYDFVAHNGREKLASWIETAAGRAGR